MTMHLVRGMSSLNNKKRKVKRKPGWEAAEAEHNKWLKKMGVHPDQLKEKKKQVTLLPVIYLGPILISLMHLLEQY